MKENPLLEQSLTFASEIIKLQKFLLKEKKETIISKQIIRFPYFNIFIEELFKREIGGKFSSGLGI